MLRFEKLYMDLVGADGTVCIAYAAKLGGLGFTKRLGGLELYAPRGEREIHRAESVEYSEADDCIEVRGTFSDGSFVMRHRPLERGWDPPGAPPHHGLRWRVVGARASAVVEIVRGGTARHVAGTGYSDWVDISRPTRLLGLSRVEWGRLHFSDATFVFNRIETARGDSWQRALSIRDGGRLETSSVSVEGDGVSASFQSEASEFLLSPTRVLNEGSVFDRERFPGLLERCMSEFLTGAAAERRVVGRARRTSSGVGSPALGWGIAEVVRFGREVRRDR